MPNLSPTIKTTVLLTILIVIYCSASAQTLNPSESADGKPVLVYQGGKVVSEIGGKQNSCPQKPLIHRVETKHQNYCYVLNEVELLGKNVVLKTPVWWEIQDRWGERFALQHPNFQKMANAPYFSKSTSQSVVQFEDYGERVSNNYQLLVAKQGENLVVDEVAFIRGDFSSFHYRIGNADYTSVKTKAICLKRNLNHIVYDGSAFDLGQLPLEFDLKNDCVYCVEQYDKSEHKYLKEKTLEYLNCQRENRELDSSLPPKECLTFCETIEEHKWSPVK